MIDCGLKKSETSEKKEVIVSTKTFSEKKNPLLRRKDKMQKTISMNFIDEEGETDHPCARLTLQKAAVADKG